MTRKHLLLLSLGVAAVLAITLVTRFGGAGPADALGINVSVSVSKPANGSFLTVGERAVVTVNLNDKSGGALTRDAFATLNLYMYGPQETAKTVTASKLLNASTDRSKTPHHYIDLLTNPDVSVSGNVLRYTLQPVSNEEAGTYIASLWASAKGEPERDGQMFALAEFQLGTATVENQIVAKENCAKCHLGASNGQFYLHHVDPGRSPFGSPSIDSIPPLTCKSCHNNDGYAAYSGNINDPTIEDPSVRTPDPLVRRVHGVHRGSGLQTNFNIDPETGNFKNYTHVVFPANVRNCNVCHVDDRFKTKPTRQACGACHDATWFGDPATKPADRKLHPGGPQADDSACAGCHQPDTGGVAPPISVAHKVPPTPFTHVVELVMSQPKNGEFYVVGEFPQVGITIKDAATGNIINPNSLVEPKDASKVQPNETRRANLFVSGPRSDTKPVLTTAAGQIPSTSYYRNNDLRVLQDKSKADKQIIRSDTKITYQLGDVKGLRPGTYTAFVETLAAPPNLGGWAVFNFQVGTKTPDKFPATNCKDCHRDTTMHSAYFAVEFNPDICKNCHDYERQIAGASGWTDRNNGFGAAPLARRVHGVHFGRYLDKPKEVHASVDYSEVIFPQDVRNCVKCHSETTSWQEKPSRLACLACHDTNAAIGHGTLNTVDPTPKEPYSGQQTETCTVCHGKAREFSPDKVHNISSPYKPPYPREPER
ncbi:MAG: hypothetical protein HYX94_04160 [Chloroflexi bacterium]|nr:hypothetical protein [Chloroflexota bacterium]